MKRRQRRRLLILFILLLIFFIVTYSNGEAQDDALSGEDVFAEGIEFTVFESSQSELRSRPEIPEIVQQRLCGGSGDYDLWARPQFSPDNHWLMFMNCDGEDTTVYSYEMTTAEISVLGQVEYFDGTVQRWVDDTTAVIGSTILGTQQTRFVYLADASQPNSLELIASQYISDPQYYDDPPRYVWVHEEFVDQGSTLQVMEYDLIERDSSVIAELGCYYRVAHCIAIPNDTAPDVDTISRIALLEHPHMGLFSRITIYDIETGDSLYRLTLDGRFGESLFTWIDEDTFLYDRQMITIGSPITEYVINDVYSINWSISPVSPNRDYVLTSDSNENGRWLNVVDLSTLERIQITQLITENRIFTSWMPDNSLLVSISNDENDTLGRWLVQIPDGG